MICSCPFSPCQSGLFGSCPNPLDTWRTDRIETCIGSRRLRRPHPLPGPCALFVSSTQSIISLLSTAKKPVFSNDLGTWAVDRNMGEPRLYLDSILSAEASAKAAQCRASSCMSGWRFQVPVPHKTQAGLQPFLTALQGIRAISLRNMEGHLFCPNTSADQVRVRVCCARVMATKQLLLSSCSLGLERPAWTALQ